MLRTPTFLSAAHKFALAAALATCLPFLAKADLGITIVTTQTGDQVTADFLVSNFNDILSIQYTVQWDPAVLQFVSVGDYALPGLTDAYFGTSNVGIGQLTHSWNNPDGLSTSIPDCASIFRINFISMNGGVSPVSIFSGVTPIEVVNADLEFLSIVQGLACNDLSRISGKIFRDDDEDCTKDESEVGLQDWQVMFKLGNDITLVSASPTGDFEFNCQPGSYEVTAISPENDFWLLCQPTFTVELPENQEVVQDFSANPSANPSGTSSTEATNFSVKIAPNPVLSGQPVYLETTTKTAGSLTLQAFDVNGKLLGSWEREAQPGTTNFSLSPALQQGLYLLKITYGHGGGRVVKLVVF